MYVAYKKLDERRKTTLGSMRNTDKTLGQKKMERTTAIILLRTISYVG